MCLTQTQKDIDPNVDFQEKECGACTRNIIRVRAESGEKDINILTTKQEKLSHVYRKIKSPNQPAERMHGKIYTQKKRKKRTRPSQPDEHQGLQEINFTPSSWRQNPRRTNCLGSRFRRHSDAGGKSRGKQKSHTKWRKSSSTKRFKRRRKQNFLMWEFS